MEKGDRARHGVFISYRRDDAAGEAGRLADHLSPMLGADSVFIDVVGITAGDDWRQRLDGALDGCDTMLVIIGQRWLEVRSATQPAVRRIDEKDDMVAWEVSRGLSRGLRLVQVLVQGAKPLVAETLPPALAALAMRQSVNLRHETFASNAQDIAAQIRRSRRTHSVFSAEWYASDLRPWAYVLDAGEEGTVAAITIVNALELLLTRAGTPKRLSIRYLYEKAKRTQRIPRSYGELVMLPALFVASFFGVPRAAVWPYIPNHTRLPKGHSWKTLDTNVGFRCWGDFFRVDGLPDAVKQLAAGRAIVCSCRIDSGSGWLFGSIAKTGDVPMPPVNVELAGGATVLLVGFDPATRRFHFLAPWGERWGKKGFGTIAVDVARRVIEPESLWSAELATGIGAKLFQQRVAAEPHPSIEPRSRQRTRVARTRSRPPSRNVH